MSKQLQWAIGGLALLIVGFVALQIYLHVDMKQFKEELADPEPKTETETEQPPDQVQVPEVDNRPPPPDDGREYEWHGDHWHEVPMEQKESMPLHEGSLTFHEELLKTNPVKALRLQTEERGHWAAKWIPPFPPDDTEAQEYAWIRYILRYYENIGNTEHPEYEKANRMFLPAYRAVKDYPHSARKSDLLKLTWPAFDEPIAVYDERGNRQQLSDFFPIWRSEAEKRAAYGDFYEDFMEIEKLQDQGLLPK